MDQSSSFPLFFSGAVFHLWTVPITEPEVEDAEADAVIKKEIKQVKETYDSAPESRPDESSTNYRYAG